MDKLKVIFIGGLTNGKIVFDYLQRNKYVDLLLTITYPDNSTKPRHVTFPNGTDVKKSGSANQYSQEIQLLKPDLIIVTGWSELLEGDLIRCTKMGTIGFHPSKLPMDRGRSVLAWQIEDGYKDTALTMFYYNELPDGGDIIGQDKIRIEDNDYVNDILDKCDLATINLMRAYFPLIRMGKAPRIKQSLTEGNFRRLRTDMDSQINWNTNSQQIYNKIRAISTPYPGAVGEIDDHHYIIYQAEQIDEFPLGANTKPGTLIAQLFDNSKVIKTKDGFIRIIKFKEID